MKLTEDFLPLLCTIKYIEMNAYRKAFFILARRRHTAIRQIGLPYLLSAVSAAILAVGLASAVYHCIAPMLVLMLENVEPSVAFSAIGLDWPGLICTTIGGFLLLGSLYSAHRATLRMLRSQRWTLMPERMKPSTDKRLLRFTLDVSMWLVIIGLVALPLVLIGVGLVESALSELMFNESNVPIWVYVAAAAFSAVGILVFEITALYRRIVGLHYHSL